MTKNEALDIAISNLSAWIDEVEDSDRYSNTEYLEEAIRILEGLRDEK
jgi:hypothetical protein